MQIKIIQFGVWHMYIEEALVDAHMVDYEANM